MPASMRRLRPARGSLMQCRLGAAGRSVRACRAACAAAAFAGCGLASLGRPLQPAWSAPALTFGERWRGPRAAPAGLRYRPDFVSPAEEAELLEVIDGKSAAWMRQIRRAQQFFGVVYYQTTQSVPELQPTAESDESAQSGRALEDLPAWLRERLRSDGLFGDSNPLNQVQGNEYLDDSGIGSHVEDPAAGPSVVTLSLLQPIQLTLQRSEGGKPLHKDVRDNEDCVKVLLEPRSLLVLEGESRWDFAHAIRQSRLVPLRDGGTLRRGKDYRRVSLTFRGIAKELRSAERRDTPDGFAAFDIRAEKAAHARRQVASAGSPSPEE